MDRTKVRRLWNIQTMKVEMFKDIRDDVEDDGYAIVSHVWGDQQPYPASKFGITGVDWNIPLSNPNKILRLKEAVQQYGKKYCWFDVLCMPQDKQDEINLEIPFMGDYYAGADMVLVLATVDPVISEEFTEWYDIMEDVMEEERDFTEEEKEWIESHELDCLDISGETWFTRLWTYQEAIMAKKLILVCNDDKHIDLFDINEKIEEMDRLNILHECLFRDSIGTILGIYAGKDNRLNGILDLAQVMDKCSQRDCFKPQDKFYGMFGILGYKDFPVDYNIGMEDLNRAIIKHAYSKGDLSWLSVDGDAETGFIQPMYKPFQHVGWIWKEDVPGSGIRLENEIMYINAWSFAKIVCHEKITIDSGSEVSELLENMYGIFRSWGLDGEDIIKNMVSYQSMSDDEAEVVGAMYEYSATKDEEIFVDVVDEFGDDFDKHIRSSMNKMGVAMSVRELTIIKATTWENKDIPLTVHGNVEKDDQIMLVRMTDSFGAVLGIVVDKYFRRKGVCVCEKVEMTEEEAISRYTSHEFPL